MNTKQVSIVRHILNPRTAAMENSFVDLHAIHGRCLVTWPAFSRHINVPVALSCAIHLIQTVDIFVWVSTAIVSPAPPPAPATWKPASTRAPLRHQVLAAHQRWWRRRRLVHHGSWRGAHCTDTAWCRHHSIRLAVRFAVVKMFVDLLFLALLYDLRIAQLCRLILKILLIRKLSHTKWKQPSH